MQIPGNVSLFQGIEASSVQNLLTCVTYTLKSAKKNELIIREGDPVMAVGIVLSGFVHIERNGYDGTRIIQAGLGQGAIFGESLVCAGIKRSPVSVMASEDSSVLLIPFAKMIRSCDSACDFHQKIIENLIKLVAEKNLMLNAKLEIASLRTIREKILAYFSNTKKARESYSFEIPFNRNELADFLCVDRSALSRELGHMRDEGFLEYNRNFFDLSPEHF